MAPPSEGGIVLWAGRSGRRYTMALEPGERLALSAGRLYVLVEDGVARWAGTAHDLIEDQVSRARFRRASTGAATLLSMPAPEDDLALMTLVWDIEGTTHLQDRSAA